MQADASDLLTYARELKVRANQKDRPMIKPPPELLAEVTRIIDGAIATGHSYEGMTPIQISDEIVECEAIAWDTNREQLVAAISMVRGVVSMVEFSADYEIICGRAAAPDPEQ